MRVPSSYVVATGGAYTKTVNGDGTTTWRYTSGKPAPFLNVSIAPFDSLSVGGARFFYFPADSVGGHWLANSAQVALRTLAEWFGPLHTQANLTITEIPDGWGSQSDLVGGIIQTARELLRSGRPLKLVAEEVGYASGPTGLAWDPGSGLLWMAERAAGQLRAIRLDGTTFATIRYVNGVALDGVTDVAVDAAAGKAWVLKQSAKAETDLAPGEPIQAARFLHAFDLDAAYLASYVPMGGALGQISRAGGVTVGAGGKVYVSDTYQGTVLALDGGGTAVGTIGTFGSAQGQLTNPTGLTPMSNGDLLVANTTLGRVERFGRGVPLPTCAGDTDCDLGAIHYAFPNVDGVAAFTHSTGCGAPARTCATPFGSPCSRACWFCRCWRRWCRPDSARRCAIRSQVRDWERLRLPGRKRFDLCRVAVPGRPTKEQ